MGPEPFDPFASTLRLFLSVDIVGSTAFKQSDISSSDESESDSRPPSEAWFSPIAQFYRQIELLFAREWRIYADKHAPKHGWEAGLAPTFWKGIGDEVVYYKDIKHHQEAYCCLHCWINVVNSYRDILHQKYPKLNVKSAAWLAGFPVNNSEIIFRTKVNDATEGQGGGDPVYDNAQLMKQFYSGNSEGLVRDFIGPSIDTGFRLAQFASPRKLIVSVDLALMLSSAEGARPHEFCYPSMKFYFDGTSSLKGVIGGSPYPIIWIDMLQGDKLEVAEDILLDRQSVNQSQLRDYCEIFISKHSKRINRPYVNGGADSLFSILPDRHAERLDKLKSYLHNEKVREQELNKSADKTVANGDDIRPDELALLLNFLKNAAETYTERLTKEKSPEVGDDVAGQ